MTDVHDDLATAEAPDWYTYKQLKINEMERLQSGNEAQHYAFMTYAINKVVEDFNSEVAATEEDEIEPIEYLKSANKPPHYKELVDKLNEVIEAIDDGIETLEELKSGNEAPYRDLFVVKVNEVVAYIEDYEEI